MSKIAKDQKSEVKLEPGAEKRLANIMSKALNTPPKHKPSKAKKAESGSKA